MNDDAPPPTIKFRRLTADDQDLVWKLLSFAAHEDSMETTKAQACCVPYAQEFDTQEGDFGTDG